MKRKDNKKEGLKESWCEKGREGIQHLRRERGNIISFRWKLRKRRWERRKVGNVSSTRTCFLCLRCSPGPPEKWQIPLWLQRRLRDGAGSYHEWRGHIDPGRWLRGDRDRERGPGRLPRSLKGRESLTNGKRDQYGESPYWSLLPRGRPQYMAVSHQVFFHRGFACTWQVTKPMTKHYAYFGEVDLRSRDFFPNKSFYVWRIILGWGGDCCQSQHCLWHLWGWLLGRILPDKGSRSDLQKNLHWN